MDNGRGTTRYADTDTGADDNKDKKEGRGCGCWILLLLVLLGGAGAGGGLMGMTVLRQETPLPGEEMMADFAARTLAIPSEYHDRRIPNRSTIGVDKGRELFKTQCSLCHGETGRADNQLGKTMYPPAADLTQPRTKNKTDGQLYYIVAHGVNLTGMPGFSKDFGIPPSNGQPGWFGPNDEDEIWSMIKYIRELQGQGEAQR